MLLEANFWIDGAKFLQCDWPTTYVLHQQLTSEAP